MKYAYLLPAALSFGVAGCVQNDLSMNIDRFLFVSQMTMCNADPANTMIRSQGLLDVGIVNGGASQGQRGYFVAPVVRNDLPERMITGGIELDAITLTGFDVELHPDPTIAAAIPATQSRFYVPVGAVRIGAGGVGMASVFAEVIPAQVARLMAASVTPGNATNSPLVLVHMRAVAEHAGSVITSAFVDYPVRICNFCLTPPPQPCPAGGFPMSAVLATACIPGQDDAVTCCTDAGSLLCGKAVPTH